VQVPLAPQVSVPQQSLELEQCWLSVEQLVPPRQKPLVQERVPQHCEELLQWLPSPKQLPSLQILLVPVPSQESVPQHSPSLVQCPPLLMQGPLTSGDVGTSTSLSQAEKTTSDTARRPISLTGRV
jgi:hypothetical protein